MTFKGRNIKAFAFIFRPFSFFFHANIALKLIAGALPGGSDAENMIYSILRIFIMNQAADTIILFIVKQRLFPEKSFVRISIGGLAASGTYIIWLCFRHILAKLVWSISGIFLISILLIAIFQIQSLCLFLSAWNSTLICASVLGGVTYCIRKILPVDIPLPTMVSVAVSFTVCLLLLFSYIKKEQFYRVRNNNLYHVEIQRGERCVKSTGLYDSGNQLTSQLTGEGICVVTERLGEKLLEEEEKIHDSDKELFFGKNIYPIQYHCIAQNDGQMIGVMADQIIVSRNGKVYVNKKGMIGICKSKLSKDNRFSVLLPEDIFSG